MQFSESKGPGGARNERKKPQLKAEYATLSKDGKSVWEPGLPAEVTSRRVHKPVRNAPVEEASIKCDLRHTLHMTPAARAEWLDKAMQAIPTGRAKVQEVFNIVTHPKFVSGVPDKVGRRMLRIVAGALDNFSDKQRITLVSKCKLAELYQSAAMLAEGEDDDGDADEELAGAGLEGDAAEEEPAASRSRSRRSRSRRGRRRSRSRRRKAVGDARGHQSPVRSQAPAARPPPPPEGARAEPPRERPPAPAARQPPPEREEPDMSPAERAGLEQALAARQRQQEEERRKLDEDRRAYEDKERQRKARLGSAFLMADEEEEDDPNALAATLKSRRKAEDSLQDLQSVQAAPSRTPQPLSQPLGHTAAGGAGQDPRFVEAMGGDRLLQEAHKILASAATTGRLGAPSPSRSPSRPRRPRRRSRSRSRGGGGARLDMRSSGSYRSPTPDGRARGAARAARKARMIASLMGMPLSR